MKLYHYPGCSTCRRARKWLAERGLEVEAVDIVSAPPSKAELRRIRERAGVELRRLFNTSGQSYREGDFKTRLPGMSEAQALAALAADGKLIKRPLLVAEQFALVGFDEAAWAEALT